VEVPLVDLAAVVLVDVAALKQPVDERHVVCVQAVEEVDAEPGLEVLPPSSSCGRERLRATTAARASWAHT
jgi:hypothetical protein